MPQPAHPLYPKIEFPTWQFREFPMAVPMKNGKPSLDTPYDAKGKALPVVVVNTQEEYDDLVGGAEVVAEESRLMTEDDERKTLYQDAENCGAVIDKRWTVERIRKAIADHKEPPL
ncbi:hypothetical protein K0U83_23855 [bacterium]|nr:hypothetical protein [bacterium]